MTRQRQDLGRLGEDLAAAHLESLGFTITDRRFRTRLGEIDIVARRPGQILFVEVKLRRQGRFGTPAESVHPGKQARLARVAAQWLAARAPSGDEAEPECRFDVIAILEEPPGRLRLEHIRDAFRP